MQGNIIMDEEIPIAPTLTTPPIKIQFNKRNDHYFDDYIASLKNKLGSLKSEETRADWEKQSDKLLLSQKSFPSILYLP